MGDDSTQEEPRSHEDPNSSIKPADEIAFGSGPSGSCWSAPPQTVTQAGAQLRKQSSSSSVHEAHRSEQTPSQNQQPHTSPGSAGISLPFPLPPCYSENIPPMKEEDVHGYRWVEYVTLVDPTSGRYRQRSRHPAGGGAFSDVWQCDNIFSDGSNVVVAVKKLRAFKLPSGLSESETSTELLKRLNKEIRIWKRLDHPNIAPLLGFAFDEEIAIISPWFSRGNLSEYLDRGPKAERMQLVRGVAAGLEYLHSSSPVIIHGDMKPDNILIDQWGCPRIIDFGLSRMVEEDPLLSSTAMSTSLRGAGCARWIAPELLLEEEWVPRSRQTDMYSFGCVAFFIFTGVIPFKTTRDRNIVIARYKGAFPFMDGVSYPNLNIEDPVMEVLRACWTTKPQDRPKIGEFVQRLNRAYPGSHLQTQPGKSAVQNLWAFLRKIFTFKGSRP